MRLTKHRDTFMLTMNAKELVFLVNNLGSNPQTVQDQEEIVKVLNELTYYQQEAYAYDKYLATMED